MDTEASHRTVEERSGRSAPHDGRPVGTELADEGLVADLGHDEFDPIGTLTLIAIYLAILVLMWLYMYFVEFLGNGPTVVG